MPLLSQSTLNTAQQHTRIMSKQTEIITDAPTCEHCNAKMKKMSVPPESGYDTNFMWVCFNDECEYFVRGWDWMQSQYKVKASYRHRVDPISGQGSPLPVWSWDAMKDRIIE